MKKFDVVIEAVRYKNGKIDVVRGYERRGATFTDCILLDREAMIELMKGGKHVVTGQRKEYYGGQFNVDKPVKLTGQDGSQVITTEGQSAHDELQGVPAF
jgi:hypothetical protein